MSGPNMTKTTPIFGTVETAYCLNVFVRRAMSRIVTSTAAFQ